jgi:hypothetical protein
MTAFVSAYFGDHDCCNNTNDPPKHLHMAKQDQSRRHPIVEYITVCLALNLPSHDSHHTMYYGHMIILLDKNCDCKIENSNRSIIHNHHS